MDAIDKVYRRVLEVGRALWIDEHIETASVDDDVCFPFVFLSREPELVIEPARPTPFNRHPQRQTLLALGFHQGKDLLSCRLTDRDHAPSSWRSGAPCCL